MNSRNMASNIQITNASQDARFPSDFTKRKRESEDTDISEAISNKKKRTNFHNIADLIGCGTSNKVSDKDEKQVSIIINTPENLNSTSPNTMTSLSRCLTPQSLDGGSNQSAPDKDYFRMTDFPQRPPSLTPPTTPSPHVTSPTSQKAEMKADMTSSVGVKKARTMYKTEQVYLLEQIFGRTQYPDPETIEILAKQLGISETKIKVWFQNKRARWRRRSHEPSPQLPTISAPSMLHAQSQIALQPIGHMLPPTAQVPTFMRAQQPGEMIQSLTHAPFQFPVPVGFPGHNMGSLGLTPAFHPQMVRPTPNIHMNPFGLPIFAHNMSTDPRSKLCF